MPYLNFCSNAFYFFISLPFTYLLFFIKYGLIDLFISSLFYLSLFIASLSFINPNFALSSTLSTYSWKNPFIFRFNLSSYFIFSSSPRLARYSFSCKFESDLNFYLILPVFNRYLFMHFYSYSYRTFSNYSFPSLS